MNTPTLNLPEISEKKKGMGLPLVIMTIVMILEILLFDALSIIYMRILILMVTGSPSPSVIWLRNGAVIDSDYTRWHKS